MTATVIRHKLSEDGFAVVVTTFLPCFAARVQGYTLYSEGHTSLAFEAVFDDERKAVAVYDTLVGV